MLAHSLDIEERGRKYFLPETKAFACSNLFHGELSAITRELMARGITKNLVKLLLSLGAALVGIMLLWRLLQVPGEILLHPSETRYLASPLEIMVIAYIALWNLKRYRLGIGEERFKIVSSALKASIVFYAIGLFAILAGYAGFCSLAGFIAAALFSLKGNLATNYLKLPRIPRLSSAVTIPVPSLSGLQELPIGLCTPPEEGTVTSYNVHLGREARAWINLSRKGSHLRSKNFNLHVEKIRKILGSETPSVGSIRSPRDVANHLSKKISRGYLLDPSKSIVEALEALDKVGRRGVETSLQFLWMRDKGGVSARHLVVASSNDLQAFSRFEADLIRKVPFTSFLEATLVVDLMADVRREVFLKPVGEVYLKYVLPIGIAYEPTYLLDMVTLRGYMGKRGRTEGALSFQFPEGHVLLIGDKSSGKTRFAQSLVSALEDMNAIVLVLDPHGEYHRIQGRSGDKLFLNPFRPPLDVDALTHSGSLLVFSRYIASAFSVEEPQEEVAKMIRLKEPLLINYLADIAGKVDRETARVRDAVTKLAEETGIDEAIRGIALPDPARNVITVEVPIHRKLTATLLTELFIAWAASLATSKQTVRVVMVIEDADEMLNLGEASDILEYAEDYGLSLILISKSCTSLVQSGQCFSIIAGFRMSRKEDAGAFRKLVGLGGGEPEGLQIEATISGLHSGESILFLRSSFDFMLARAQEA